MFQTIYYIVKSHGGKLHLDNQEDAGITFFIEHPAKT